MKKIRRLYKIALHHIRKIKRSENYKLKKNYLTLMLFLFFLFSISAFFIKKSFATYQSTVDLDIKIENAVYLLEEDKINFNMTTDGIVPSTEAYVYSFTIANYNDEKQSEVDLIYKLSMRTTTNLPLKYELYRNPATSPTDGVNLLTEQETVQDEDGAWYHEFTLDDTYTFLYEDKTIDTYYLLVYFDSSYSNNVEYADSIENIEITVDSKQIIE